MPLKTWKKRNAELQGSVFIRFHFAGVCPRGALCTVTGFNRGWEQMGTDREDALLGVGLHFDLFADYILITPLDTVLHSSASMVSSPHSKMLNVTLR